MKNGGPRFWFYLCIMLILIYVELINSFEFRCLLLLNFIGFYATSNIFHHTEHAYVYVNKFLREMP